MKKIFLLSICFASVISCFAQKQTFDITTYTPPKGWAKQATNDAVQFSKQDEAKGTYCMMTLYKAVPGTQDAKKNFDLTWESVLKEMVTITAAPEMQPSDTENGWETHSGYAPFESDGSKGIAILVTASGYDKMANLIILTNSDVYEKEMTAFLESISLKKLTASTSPKTIPGKAGEPPQTPVTTASNAAILGTWSKSESDNSNYRVQNGVMNYITRQYTFNANGTYLFISKAYDPLMDKILLGRETGTYLLSGNTITVNPQKSVLQGWSKNNGRDEWGKLISTQNIVLEKATYQFTKNYSDIMKRWELVLQASKETKRDGYFSSNTSFSNAYFYAAIAFNNKEIVLPN